MRAIVETESPSYLLHRAQELLRDADQSTERFQSNEAIRKAISLLALHLVKDDLFMGHTPPGTRKNRGEKKESRGFDAKNRGEKKESRGFDANGDRLSEKFCASGAHTGRS